MNGNLLFRGVVSYVICVNDQINRLTSTIADKGLPFLFKD
jgi:hypothetical protein